MEKRTLVAVILTIAVWIGWFWLFAPKNQITDTRPKTTAEDNLNTSQKPASENKEASSIGKPVSPSSRLIKEEQATFKTSKFVFELSNRGAVISKANYSERNINLTLNQKLFNSSGNIDFSIHFSEGDFKAAKSLDSELWHLERIDDRTVKFFTDVVINGNPLRIEKIFRFTEKGYEFTVDYRFVNTGKQPVKFNDGAVIFSPSDTLGPKLDYVNRYNLMTGIYSINGSYEHNSKGGGFFSKAEDFKKKAGNINYTGIMSRYFLLIMIPQKFNAREIIFDNRPNTGYRTGMFVSMNDIPPGADQVKSFKVYLGEKDKEMLGSVDPNIVDASDVSTIIEPIRYFVIWALKWINKLFGNLGWSLVAFSIITKIVFMPLTKKSTDSMRKMQELSPQIKKIQEKFRDKPEVVQRETMKLYKDNKVNPLGGCLPLILQMPFFFALYSALINSIDLWNAPFMLWIKDLSMPDTVFSFSGFDLNILPLLMTVTTIIQQKQTMVESGSQQQKIMMYMMPVILLFIFWTMPSGLVLYWFLQNLYQIINQYVINIIGKKKLEMVQR